MNTSSNCFVLGYGAGLDLTNEKNMLCIKAEGFKEFRKQLTAEQMKVIKEIFYGERIEHEHNSKLA